MSSDARRSTDARMGAVVGAAAVLVLAAAAAAGWFSGSIRRSRATARRSRSWAAEAKSVVMETARLAARVVPRMAAAMAKSTDVH